MRRSFLLTVSLLLLAACSSARAQHPDQPCCSTYPIYLCPPGYLSYPAPPRDLTIATGWNSCWHGCCDGGATACGVITPNPYSCCFYGVTLSNYALVTPPAALQGVPGRLPVLPATPAEKLPNPNPR
jgi:hypothetical protein